MLLVIVLAALAVWATVATFIELRRDGYRRIPTDWSLVAGRDHPVEQVEAARRDYAQPYERACAPSRPPAA